ncbi:hypothetical protein ACFL4P_00125 [Gemmatimonadota bacterium]
MTKYPYQTLSASILMLLLISCSGGPDPSREFGMYLNGRERKTGLGDPVGLIQELDAGYSYSNFYSVVFPLKILGMSGVPRPGILIKFDPAATEPGREITFGSEAENSIRVEYHPVSGHKINQAVMLAYSSGHGEGGGTIRFDMLETGPGGRVKGTVVQAVLYGYYENMQTMEFSEPSKPMKLELFNWSFDVTLERSIF